ncbi:uncharacterized protein LOC123506325 [Portunus trituberculatus]|uniref:uncharacterized protein LOC123506325 n=1 Tax=Portunus trituberculatus TaxID=210409 RepID=UPI001E1CC6F5|nr:uncharacterized protein LOC123506325 [Portunus trituberculatus]
MASALAPRPFSQAKSLNGVCTECAFVLLLLTVEDRNIAAAAGTNWHRNGYGLGQVRSFALRDRSSGREEQQDRRADGWRPSGLASHPCRCLTRAAAAGSEAKKTTCSPLTPPPRSREGGPDEHHR